MAKINDEKQILSQVLDKDKPAPLPAVLSGAAVNNMTVLQTKIGSDTGIAPLPPDDRSKAVATVSPTAPEEDNLYSGLLTRDTEVASASVAPEVFQTL